jgi:hypothetical protein
MRYGNLKTKTPAILIFLIYFFTGELHAATLFSRPDGTWSATDGGSDCGCVPTQNDQITVNHSITINVTFVLNTGTLVINSPATLTIGGDLTFNNGSTVMIASGATLHVQGDFSNKNNSSAITINGSLRIDGNFQNGQGAGTGAVINVGPGGEIAYGGNCSNAGTVIDFTGSYTGCNRGVLPVELLFFHAEGVDKGVSLQWATASEYDFDKFIIERASGKLLFEELSEIPGHETSREIMHYQFTDRTPAHGKNYYRLKMIDLDGSFEYSTVVTQEVDTDPMLWVYPVPGDGKAFSYRINAEPCNYSYITVFDNIGHQVLTKPIYSTAGKIEFNPPLATGLYTINYFPCAAQGRVSILRVSIK